MSEIEVGLVGYGTAGAFFHAPLIAATPGLRLSAVVTGNPARADEVADPYGAVAVGDAGRAVGPLRPRGGRLTEQHPRAAGDRGAQRAVCRSWWTSRWPRTAEEARGLIRLARDRGLMLTVFQNRRWDGDFLT